MKDAYVFDLDGTLADLTHRLHHITPPKKKDWPSFFATCHHDQPIWWVIKLMQTLVQGDPEAAIIVLSGRMDHVRDKTEWWLEQHCVPYTALWMRKKGDYRDDTVVKLELMKQYQQANPDVEVRFIVDDRQKVVDMWRANGFNVLQCAAWQEVEGTYEKE